MQYTQDYDEKVPPVYVQAALNSYTLPNGQLNQNGAMLWPVMLYPYIKNIQIMNCPSESDPNISWTNGGYSSIPYAYNYFGRPGSCTVNCGVLIADYYKSGASLAAFEDPAQTITVTDARWFMTWVAAAPYTEALATNPADGICEHDYGSGCVRARHNGMVATLFWDGHVKAMNWKTILGCSDVSCYRYWTTSAD